MNAFWIFGYVLVSIIVGIVAEIWCRLEDPHNPLNKWLGIPMGLLWPAIIPAFIVYRGVIPFCFWTYEKIDQTFDKIVEYIQKKIQPNS